MLNNYRRPYSQNKVLPPPPFSTADFDWFISSANNYNDQALVQEGQIQSGIISARSVNAVSISTYRKTADGSPF